jgi:hypothetical protein
MQECLQEVPVECGACLLDEENEDGDCQKQ